MNSEKDDKLSMAVDVGVRFVKVGVSQQYYTNTKTAIFF